MGEMDAATYLVAVGALVVSVFMLPLAIKMWIEEIQRNRRIRDAKRELGIDQCP